MLKRHTNMTIKLLLIIIFVILIMVILRSAETVEPLKETVVIEITPTITPHQTSQETEVIEPTIIPSPTPIEENCYRAKIKKWEKEYYYATKTYRYLRQKNFSPEVICGIIGNMMIETSGGALDIKPNIYSADGEYYGLCQWSLDYYPETFGLSFEQQLAYLIESMPVELNTFGWLYKDDFDYEDFFTIKDPAEAALAFAKSYERCDQASYELRKEAALRAYEYFDLTR